MSHFCGFHNLVLFFLFIFFTATSTFATQENPSLEASTREDMVKFAGYGEEKLSTVLVTGSIHCEACLHGGPQLRAWPVSGVLVAVKCHSHGKKSRSRWAQAVTDEIGDFVVDLPSQLHAVPNLERTCSVRVLRMPKNSPCRPARVMEKTGLRPSPAGDGIRIYSAGRIKFQHLTSRPLQACVKGSGDGEMLW